MPGKAASDAVTIRTPEPTELVRPLCHEVGNLLAAIRLSGHLLRGPEGAAQRERSARELESLAAQAGALLAQMRPLFEPGSESRVRVTTGSLLASAGRAVEEEVPEGVTFRVATRRNLPDVRVDTEALHHLLVTLLLGAFETAGRGDRVRIDAEPSGRRVVVRIRDDGPPLHHEPARPEMLRGRELGVRLAAAVVKASGGRVRTASGVRRGNRIELWLPAVAAAARRASGRSTRR